MTLPSGAAHLFVRLGGRDDVVVCRKTVNVGMLFAQTRRVVRDIGNV